MPSHKRIELEDVVRKVAENRQMGQQAMKAELAAGIPMAAPTVMVPDPSKPWVIRIRDRNEKNAADPELGWTYPPKLQFKSLRTASMVAEDLSKMDSRLEIQIGHQDTSGQKPPS